MVSRDLVSPKVAKVKNSFESLVALQKGKSKEASGKRKDEQGLRMYVKINKCVYHNERYVVVDI